MPKRPAKISKVKHENPDDVDDDDDDNSITLASFSLDRNDPLMELPSDEKRRDKRKFRVGRMESANVFVGRYLRGEEAGKALKEQGGKQKKLKSNTAKTKNNSSTASRNHKVANHDEIEVDEAIAVQLPNSFRHTSVITPSKSGEGSLHYFVVGTIVGHDNDKLWIGVNEYYVVLLNGSNNLLKSENYATRSNTFSIIRLKPQARRVRVFHACVSRITVELLI